MPKPKKSQRISDPNHSLIQRILSLRGRDARDEQQTFFIEGVRMLLTAERAGAAIHAVIHSPKLLTSGAARKTVRRLRKAGVKTRSVSPELFRTVSTAHHASGVGAIVAQRWTQLHWLQPKPGDFWLGVRHLRSTGNFGTLVRSAAAMDAAGVMLFGATLDPYDAGALRASMGAMLEIDLVRTTHADLRGRDDFAVVGAATDGARPIFEADLTRPTVALLGHERHGLTDEEVEMCDELVKIPMPGDGSSLNAGVAASVFAYEAARQRLTAGA